MKYWYFLPGILLCCDVRFVCCEGGEWYTVVVKVAFLLGCGSLSLKQLILTKMQSCIGSGCDSRSRTEECCFSTQ